MEAFKSNAKVTFQFYPFVKISHHDLLNDTLDRLVNGG